MINQAAYNRANEIQLRRMSKQIDRLPKHFSLTRRRNFAKKSLNIYLRAAEAKAPKDTGNLSFSIKHKIFRNNKGFVFAGPIAKPRGSRSKKKIKNDGWYARLIEYGFRNFAFPRKGQTIDSADVFPSRITKVEPKPFLRPAFDATKNAVYNDLVKRVTKAVKAYQRKVAR